MRRASVGERFAHAGFPGARSPRRRGRARPSLGRRVFVRARGCCGGRRRRCGAGRISVPPVVATVGVRAEHVVHRQPVRVLSERVRRHRRAGGRVRRRRGFRRRRVDPGPDDRGDARRPARSALLGAACVRPDGLQHGVAGPGCRRRGGDVSRRHRGAGVVGRGHGRRHPAGRGSLLRIRLAHGRRPRGLAARAGRGCDGPSHRRAEHRRVPVRGLRGRRRFPRARPRVVARARAAGAATGASRAALRPGPTVVDHQRSAKRRASCVAGRGRRGHRGAEPVVAGRRARGPLRVGDRARRRVARHAGGSGRATHDARGVHHGLRVSGRGRSRKPRSQWRSSRCWSHGHPSAASHGAR